MIIPTNLVCVLLDLAIPTSSFNYFYTYKYIAIATSSAPLHKDTYSDHGILILSLFLQYPYHYPA